MRIALLLTIFFTYSFTTVGQGFYDHNNLLINRKSIIKLNISSVTATTFYPDSCFHPLSNFVFEYKFDRSGNINKRKYWNTQLDGNNYLYVTLVIDTIYFIPQFQRFNYYCVSQSKVVKFNQYKERKRLYIRKVFNKLGLMQSQNNNCWSRGTEESDFFVDTTLLNKRVNIPRWLIPAGDSIALFKDTLLVFNKNEAS
ncbi:MAG: hypothetical protein K9J13_16325, partial [Saprospiraceae bacterium]|nr:hypothetical protein [Saprospiraceae bacterium]